MTTFANLSAAAPWDAAVFRLRLPPAQPLSSPEALTPIPTLAARGNMTNCAGLPTVATTASEALTATAPALKCREPRKASDWLAALLRFLGAVVFLALGSAPANAASADWRVEALSGSAFLQTKGAWVPLHPDDRVPLGATVKTGPEGRVAVKRLGVRLNIESNTKVEIGAGANAKLPTITMQSGLIGLDLRAEAPTGFRIRTPKVTTIAMTGTFSVSADRETATVAVRRGAAHVTAPKDNTEADVKADQAARYTSEDGLTVSMLADLKESAMLTAAADNAAGRPPAPGSQRAGIDESPIPAPSQPAESVAKTDEDAQDAEDLRAIRLLKELETLTGDSKLVSVDPRLLALQDGLGLGSAAADLRAAESALPGANPNIAGPGNDPVVGNLETSLGAGVEDPTIVAMQKRGYGAASEAEAAADEADATPEGKGKAKIKVGAVAAMVEEMAPEQADIDFSDLGDAAQSHKTVIKHKHPRPAQAMLRMRLYEALSLLDPSMAALLGMMLSIAIFFTSVLTNAILGSAGFGTLGNAALALVGSATGAAVRDVFFFSDFWYRYEPNISLFLIVGFALASLLGACVAKAEWSRRVMSRYSRGDRINLLRRRAGFKGTA